VAKKSNMDGSYFEGDTRIFPDGKRFSMSSSKDQKALEEYYKSGGFARVQTGTTERREKYYTGPSKAGGSGWQSKTVSSPSFGYLRIQPF